jgi:biofilm protein TabA
MKSLAISFLIALMATTPPTKKAITKWVNQREWAHGLRLKPHSSVNLDSFYVAYHRNQKLWDSAFAFLRDRDLSAIQPGKYPILGDQVYAMVSAAPSHKMEEVKWESHKKYIDLHYIIKGREMIGIADTSRAIITKPYTDDVINYEVAGKYYLARPGHFFLFFPNDAHRPTILVTGYDVVKKIVIKIQTAVAN